MTVPAISAGIASLWIIGSNAVQDAPIVLYAQMQVALGSARKPRTKHKRAVIVRRRNMLPVNSLNIGSSGYPVSSQASNFPSSSRGRFRRVFTSFSSLSMLFFCFRSRECSLRWSARPMRPAIAAPAKSDITTTKKRGIWAS